jgi:hypothetical protein
MRFLKRRHSESGNILVLVVRNSRIQEHGVRLPAIVARGNRDRAKLAHWVGVTARQVTKIVILIVPKTHKIRRPKYLDRYPELAPLDPIKSGSIRPVSEKLCATSKRI